MTNSRQRARKKRERIGRCQISIICILQTPNFICVHSIVLRSQRCRISSLSRMYARMGGGDHVHSKWFLCNWREIRGEKVEHRMIDQIRDDENRQSSLVDIEGNNNPLSPSLSSYTFTSAKKKTIRVETTSLDTYDVTTLCAKKPWSWKTLAQLQLSELFLRVGLALRPTECVSDRYGLGLVRK